MILKDASPYNVQWRGARPVFIDIPSFEPLPKGAPWVGYRQFCELFLYPLMLQAYKGADFRPWLRGRIDGIPAAEMRRLMSLRDLARPGVLLHVVAQNALQRRYSASRRNVRGTLADAGFDKALIVNNVDKLAGLIGRLAPARQRTEWSDYDRTHSYDAAEAERKAAFVREVGREPAVEAGVGPRLQHGILLADPRGAQRLRRRDGRRPGGDRSALPGARKPSPTAGSCRSWSIWRTPSPNQGWLGGSARDWRSAGVPS